jgi:cellulose synthase/poly-beta-1,6-N-acetylglucosamine synthase-like glycosyltransferase
MQPFVSIITPTYQRQIFLKKALNYVCLQDYPNWEWLIWDDSPEPMPEFLQLTQQNIHYIYANERLSIGEKRNRLIELAKGEIIIHVDDDDYYHPNYITSMLNHLQHMQADLLNLRGWYVYDLRTQFFGYWNLTVTTGLHYRCDATKVSAQIFDAAMTQALQDNYLGYGFGYIYRKALWASNPYPDINYGEDTALVCAALRQGFHIDGVLDTEGICLHYVHPQSTSICFPQYHLPSIAAPKIFPALNWREFIAPTN